MCIAVALADAWAAPILTTESGAGVTSRSIETVVLTRERGTPSLYESMSSAVRRMILGEGGLDKQTTQYLDTQSRLELQGELRRLEQQRKKTDDCQIAKRQLLLNSQIGDCQRGQHDATQQEEVRLGL